MPEDAATGLMRRFAARAAGWPPLLRDLVAASLALWSVCLGELLILGMPLPAEAALALPGALLAWWTLGWMSGVFALVAAALAVHLLAGTQPGGLMGGGAQQALCLLAVGAALIGCGLGLRIWAGMRERRAALLLDACAQDALERIALADARLAQAEADAADARDRLARAQVALGRAQRAAADAALPREPRDDGIFDAARRSEGGI